MYANAVYPRIHRVSILVPISVKTKDVNAAYPRPFRQHLLRCSPHLLIGRYPIRGYLYRFVSCHETSPLTQLLRKLHSTDQLDEVLDDSLTVVLLDKDNIVKEIPPPNDGDYLPKEPTEKLFQDCCNEFWWCSPYVAKGLWRQELTYAKYMLDVVIREQLMKMLTWYFGIKTDFNKSPGKLGKYLRNDVEPELWIELEKTYSDANVDNIWGSLFTMGSLFRQVANEVATVYGFKYPQRDDQNVTGYLWRIKKLPRDATEI